MTGRRAARTRTRTRTRPRWDAFGACVHTYAHTRTHCCVHTYARTHVPSRARLVRARSRPARPRVGASAAVGARWRGHSQVLEVRPLDRRRQRRELGVVRVPARTPCGRAGRCPAHPRSRAGRPLAPAMRARGSADGRRPATPPPPHPTPRGPAPAPGAAAPRAAAQRPAPPRTRTAAAAAGAGRTGSPRACTGRATREAPSPSWRRSTCRAPRARAAAPAVHQRADVGANAPKPWKADRACPKHAPACA
jgi:hypothetical protein